MATSVRHDTGPYLLPSSRSKVRHLVSISLRNISLEAVSLSPKADRRRARGQTIDDNAIPETLQSPAKLVALRERATLEHSRSSSDLRGLNDESAIDTGHDGAGDKEGEVIGVEHGSPEKNKLKGKGSVMRPRMPGRMRRRSTLEWAHSTPQRRQERLERALEERMVDVFFSLHVAGIQEPVYISEVVERTMNATFRRVNWEPCGPGITRLEALVVKVWVKRQKTPRWRQLMDVDVALGGLQYLGQSLDSISTSLPHNAILFHTTDGIYTPPTSLDAFKVPHLSSPAQSARTASYARVLPTSSFDALLRLAKLDDSIQDALTMRNKLASDLEKLLESHSIALEERDQVAEAEDRLKTIEYARSLVQKQVAKARTQIDEKQSSISQRRKFLSDDLATRQQTLESIQASRTTSLPASRDEHAILQKSIHAQRRRITTTLSTIYPITPVPNQPLQFRISGLHLPNSDALDSTTVSNGDPETMGAITDTLPASLGYVAHVLQLLSHYVRSPLPYPLNVRSSTSTIVDFISKLPTNVSAPPSASDEQERKLRTYPLYSRSAPRFRFEYAVFLLDKDIQVVLEKVYGVKVVDVRQTLPNLMYLMYVAMAGEGEVPGRKVGDIRALMGGDSGSSGGALGRVGSGSSGANGRPISGGRGAAESLRGIIGPRKG